MNQYELEEKFNINIPDFDLVPLGAPVAYVDPMSGMQYKTSVENLFSFFRFPFPNNSSVNDFDFYSVPILEEKKILPFGDDGGGYFFCIDYRNRNKKPKIVLWIRDNEEPYDIVDIASSFDEFINNLKSEEVGLDRI
ncbi:MAG: SMI1/KNR4 family protein [Alphaproteobacteria bacterium]|nr:SMI1/KNR4 family protein [Alphaproteobacteria bacterium]